MSFSITAELPLGTYRGRVQGQVTDRVPSPARLHSALLAAAGFGPRSEIRDDEWGPCDADVAALRWIEQNPPDAVSVPALHVSEGPAVAYREDGTIESRPGRKMFSKLAKRDPVVAVDGPFVWTWTEPPPVPVAAALQALCPDVSHLGSAESPVRLVVSESDVAPTHRLGSDADSFTSLVPRHDVGVARPGRLDELAEAHHRDTAAPTMPSDRTFTKGSSSPVPPRRAVTTLPYLAVEREPAAVPWSTVLTVPMRMMEGPGAIAERDRVAWAVAAHRALIRILDRDAPPALTGVYPGEAPRPVNRVALHVITADHPVTLPADAHFALAVLIPHDVGSSQTERVSDAVHQLRNLHPRGREARVIGRPEVRDGDLFWEPPAPGTHRLWRTSPPAVPDTRGHRGWTFAHAALLSLGFLFKDRLPRVAGRGEQRDNGMVEAVNTAGAVVLGTEPLRTSRIGDYVHRVHTDAVVRPYRATLHLGDLAPERAVTAIGQARHLGGGLLVPDDRPAGSALETAPVGGGG